MPESSPMKALQDTIKCIYEEQEAEEDTDQGFHNIEEDQEEQEQEEEQWEAGLSFGNNKSAND